MMLSASNSSSLRELIGKEITALADVDEDALEGFCRRSEPHDDPVRLACTGVTPADLAAGLRAVWSTFAPAHPNWTYRSDWVQLAPPPTPAQATGRWILLRFRDDANPVPESVCAALADGEFMVEGLEPSADAGQVAEAVRQHVDAAGASVGVLCLLPAAHEVTVEAERTTDLVTRTLAVLQGCRHLDCRVWVVTTAAVSAAGSAVRDAAHAAVWGLGRAMGLEYPNRWGGLIDLKPSDGSTATQTFARALTDSAHEDEFAVRGELLWVRRLVPVPMPSRVDVASHEGAVLVTGGTGGVGANLARRLARRGTRHLVLVSRRGPLAPGADALSRELRLIGCRVDVVACDVADPAALASLLDRLAADETPVHHVYHLAGDVSLTKPLSSITPKDVAAVMSAKVMGARHLDALLGTGLETFVLFSSMASTVSTINQAAYAAANAYLDGLADIRRGRGQVATAVQWGAWNSEITERHRQGLEMFGLRVMDIEPALDVLESLGPDTPSPLLVTDADWARFTRLYSASHPRPLLAALAAEASTSPATNTTDTSHSLATTADTTTATTELQIAAEWGEQGALRARMAVAPVARHRRGLVLNECRAAAAAVLGVQAGQIDIDAPLTSLGFDSLLALQFKKRLEWSLETELPDTLAWRHPTLDALATNLCDQIDLATPVARATVLVPGGAEHQDLEADEVEALILERLAALEDVSSESR